MILCDTGPLDLADASLVTAAETIGVSRIFTIDSHFFAYRINGVTAFEIVPT
jgi:predicted nucleic acid-binding protein